MVFSGISITAIILLSVCFAQDANTGNDSKNKHPIHKVDVFGKFLKNFNLEGNLSLPIRFMESSLSKFYSRYYCSSKPKCKKPLCFTAKEILGIVQLNSSSDVITREEFSNFSLVLLYHLQNVSNDCQSPGGSFINYQTKMMHLLTEDSKTISKIKVDLFLHKLLNLGHQDDDDHDNEDHARDGHGEHSKDSDDGHNDHDSDDDDDDDHDDHDHDGNGHDDDDHDDDGNGHDDDDHDDDGNGHDDDDHDDDGNGHDDDDHDDDGNGHDDDDHDDDGNGHDDDDHDDDGNGHDNHDHDDDGNGHDDDDALPLVFKKKCFSVDIILDQADVLKDEASISDKLQSISEIIVGHIFSTSTIHESCRLLPERSAFINYIFNNFGSKNHMSKDDFKKLIKLLGLGTKNQEKEAHDHQHSKRAVQPMKKVSDCFDSSELLAIFKDQNDNASLLLPEKFRELSPALIQQLLSSSCRKKADKPSQYKHYGYGILAVAVICFCSLLGVFMNICQKKVYGYTMAFFEGLAVGTLATDALLHLIPQALGIHSHESMEADESSQPNPLWFCLATFAGTYGFYLLEVGFTVVTKESEHSHDLPKDTKLSEVYTTTNEKNNSLENPKSMAEPNIPEKPNKCSSLSLIVILGDALHNFADGLTIGAAFSTSESFGLMTSIAVLCHEIPHELGDFAVLLANGIGFKRALLFNFVSSLTAFVGLFIGLGVSTDFIVRRWIYAVSAGMFLYIAFVDLFPVMKKHKTVKSLVSLFSNAGLILGVIIITLLGFYEEKIVGH